MYFRSHQPGIKESDFSLFLFDLRFTASQQYCVYVFKEMVGRSPVKQLKTHFLISSSSGCDSLDGKEVCLTTIQLPHGFELH